MTTHRFYAPASAFSDGSIVLAEGEVHHLRDVLRHTTGDLVNVFDGNGHEFSCRVRSISKKSAELEIINEVESIKESPLTLTVAAALLKGEKFDLVVKKCVELGVTALIPLVTDRCDVRINETAKRVERWSKLVIDASRQCGRATLMRVDQPTQFSDFLGRAADIALFSERGGTPFDDLSVGSEVTAVIGPEGGWSDNELAMARESRASIVTLRGRILRAETAAISIATILQHRFGDLN